MIDAPSVAYVYFYNFDYVIIVFVNVKYIIKYILVDIKKYKYINSSWNKMTITYQDLIGSMTVV